MACRMCEETLTIILWTFMHFDLAVNVCRFDNGAPKVGVCCCSCKRWCPQMRVVQPWLGSQSVMMTQSVFVLVFGLKMCLTKQYRIVLPMYIF